MPNVALFVEDFAHKTFLKAMVQRSSRRWHAGQAGRRLHPRHVAGDPAARAPETGKRGRKSGNWTANVTSNYIIYFIRVELTLGVMSFHVVTSLPKS
jgi:hypothetical protein